MNPFLNPATKEASLGNNLKENLIELRVHICLYNVTLGFWIPFCEY